MWTSWAFPTALEHLQKEYGGHTQCEKGVLSALGHSCDSFGHSGIRGRGTPRLPMGQGHSYEHLHLRATLSNTSRDFSGHYSRDWSECVHVIGAISEPFAREFRQWIVNIRVLLWIRHSRCGNKPVNERPQACGNSMWMENSEWWPLSSGYFWPTGPPRQPSHSFCDRECDCEAYLTLFRIICMQVGVLNRLVLYCLGGSPRAIGGAIVSHNPKTCTKQKCQGGSDSWQLPRPPLRSQWCRAPFSKSASRK